MTQEVSDEKLGIFAKQQNDWFRRIKEGSLDPDEVACAVQHIINRRSLEQIRIDIFNAYCGNLDAVRKNVLAYIMMVVGMGSSSVGETEALKIDEIFVNAVEDRMYRREQGAKEALRRFIRNIHSRNPDYDFMDNPELVKAVIDVRLESDFERANSLIGALANRTNEENVKLYNRIIAGLIRNGYKTAEAEEAVHFFCTRSR
ncbi:MAG: hypothetical protein HYW69_03160 [Candidatus Nealsonbacteria bacterium]|nr:hypothetical protein [Candidatus Nealsonbacteria bacterium]